MGLCEMTVPEPWTSASAAEVAQAAGAVDMFVFRRVSEGRYVHLGGAGSRHRLGRDRRARRGRGAVRPERDRRRHRPAARRGGSLAGLRPVLRPRSRRSPREHRRARDLRCPDRHVRRDLRFRAPRARAARRGVGGRGGARRSAWRTSSRCSMPSRTSSTRTRRPSPTGSSGSSTRRRWRSPAISGSPTCPESRQSWLCDRRGGAPLDPFARTRTRSRRSPSVRRFPRASRKRRTPSCPRRSASPTGCSPTTCSS